MLLIIPLGLLILFVAPRLQDNSFTSLEYVQPEQAPPYIFVFDTWSRTGKGPMLTFYRIRTLDPETGEEIGRIKEKNRGYSHTEMKILYRDERKLVIEGKEGISHYALPTLEEVLSPGQTEADILKQNPEIGEIYELKTTEYGFEVTSQTGDVYELDLLTLKPLEFPGNWQDILSTGSKATGADLWQQDDRYSQAVQRFEGGFYREEERAITHDFRSLVLEGDHKKFLMEIDSSQKNALNPDVSFLKGRWLRPQSEEGYRQQFRILETQHPNCLFLLHQSEMDDKAATQWLSQVGPDGTLLHSYNLADWQLEKARPTKGFAQGNRLFIGFYRYQRGTRLLCIDAEKKQLIWKVK